MQGERVTGNPSASHKRGTQPLDGRADRRRRRVGAVAGREETPSRSAGFMLRLVSRGVCHAALSYTVTPFNSFATLSSSKSLNVTHGTLWQDLLVRSCLGLLTGF